jgi:FlaA1/EpsC-like NDP-sugar epimerase
MKVYKDKKILITGVCGTVGKELLRQLLLDADNSPSEIVGLDNNESELFFLDQEYLADERVSFFVSDIRDKDDLISKTSNINIIFHAAALKHVILCEKSPKQTIETNIIGTQNVIYSANHNKVDIVIFTSSDKAVNPTNVMGTSKLMGERLITAANCNKRSQGTIFASSRFGNVLGSNGSVVSIFRNQIKTNGPLTITNKLMSRFVMSIEESAKLVLDAADQAIGGEVFVTKMPAIRIIDLAKAMIKELYENNSTPIDIIEIGSKPGEKLYEELVSQEEMNRTIELEKFFSILPAFRGSFQNINYNYNSIVNNSISKPYISNEENLLSIKQIRAMLSEYKLL